MAVRCEFLSKSMGMLPGEALWHITWGGNGWVWRNGEVRMLSGKWRNITDIPKHKLLKYCQIQQCFVFSTDHMFWSKEHCQPTITSTLIIRYSTVLIVPVMWIPYELHSLYKHIKIVRFIMSWPVTVSKLFVNTLSIGRSIVKIKCL